MPSTPFPPVPPMLKGSPRRQARMRAVREAACVDQCCAGINPISSPRTPRRRGLRAEGARPEGKGAAAIGFCDAGIRGGARGFVDCIALDYATLDSTKASGRFARFEHPRNVLFLPRVDTFHPRVQFSAHWPISLSFLNFSEEKEGGKAATTSAAPSTGPQIVKKVYPRVGPRIHGFSVDEKTGSSKHWRGLAADSGPIHASTGCFPCGCSSMSRLGAAIDR
jgi:hypothetical protein